MSDYYVGHCDFSDKEWEEVDSQSRQDFCDLLSTTLSDYVQNIAESSGCCSWDISCEMSNHKVVFELKDRNMDHNRFGDIMVEKDKYDNNQRYCPGFAIVAVNLFKDGVIAMCAMKRETMTISKKRCPATTLCRGANHEYVWKECATMPQKAKFKKIENIWRRMK